MNQPLSNQKWEEVQAILNAFLELKGYRKTQERLMILEEIYSRNDHFNAEELYSAMLNKNFRISRGTIYNNLDLLVESGLVRKHQFGNNQAHYEKASGFRQHSHLICVDCHRVSEFCDPRLLQIQQMVGDVLKFEVTSHELLLYGSCTRANCENKPASPPEKSAES
jgi:Fur family ferric uptake transcriptional regulator